MTKPIRWLRFRAPFAWRATRPWCATTPRARWSWRRAQPFDLILTDVVMPRRDGLALLEDLKNAGVTAPVVMMCGQAHIEMAVRATRLGALDFLEKPLSTDKLLLTVENALKLKRLEAENRDLRTRVGKHELVWTGETMRRVMAQIERVAASESRVCIYGETGTGKELVARTLHEKSHRAGGPFVTLNCAAVPAELIESELFGHEKGSFTGAAQRHTGKFEQAHRGTLFLDEIGDMPAAMQAKLLRVLEEGEVERIGGDKPTTVDVRVIVATHRNLEQLVEAGAFRRDLYHRVVVFPVELPPLRKRCEDLPALVEHFARQVSAQNGWKPVPFTASAIEAFKRLCVARAIFANCATWWSACFCSPTTRSMRMQWRRLCLQCGTRRCRRGNETARMRGWSARGRLRNGCSSSNEPRFLRSWSAITAT